jgi:hypothetical protein
MIDTVVLRKVVERNNGFCDLSTRAKTDNAVYFVYDLLQALGDTETAEKIKKIYNELENLNTVELAKLEIWR